jgi:hypothetical protein
MGLSAWRIIVLVAATTAWDCGGATPDAQTVPPPPPHNDQASTGGDGNDKAAAISALLEHAEQTCQSVQASNLPVVCEMGDLGGVPAVVMRFTSDAESTQYLGALAKQVGAPFCAATTSAGVQAGLVVMVDAAYRTYDCASDRWSEWNRPDEADLDAAKQACAQISDAKDIPVHCEMAVVENTPAVFLTFHTEDALRQYKDAAMQRVGVPFCQAANAHRVGALVVAFSGRRAQVFRCSLGVWGDWIQMAAPPPRAEVRF